VFCSKCKNSIGFFKQTTHTIEELRQQFRESLNSDAPSDEPIEKVCESEDVPIPRDKFNSHYYEGDFDKVNHYVRLHFKSQTYYNKFLNWWCGVSEPSRQDGVVEEVQP
jgi:hypothetical protein